MNTNKMLTKKVFNTIKFVIMLVVFVLFVFPFVVIVLNSFKSNGQILENPFSLPTSISFDHISEVIDRMNFLVTFKNSVIITVISVTLILITSAMCAHYLVRNNTKFSKAFFGILVSSMIIPFQALMIPLMRIYGKELDLIDRFPIPLLILLYGGFGSALSVFIYHGFIKYIPVELEEAARIDGCTKFQTFFKIVFPILKPTTVTIAILNLMWIWNDYLLPSLILTKEKVRTMPIQMKEFNGQYMNNWELLIPAMLMTILPLLIVYFIAQRSIIEGVMKGSIK